MDELAKAIAANSCSAVEIYSRYQLYIKALDVAGALVLAIAIIGAIVVLVDRMGRQ